MKRLAPLNGGASRWQSLPVALVAVCIFARTSAGAPQAAPQASPGQQQQQSGAAAGRGAKPASGSASGTEGVAPAPAVASPAPAVSPVAPPASQPVVARAGIDQTPMRRDAPRADARAISSTTSDPREKAPGFDLPRVLGALTIVLALIFALRWVLRRTAQPGTVPGATNVVQVLTRSPVSPRQQLLLVRVGRRLLVVADCNGQLNALSEISDADEVASLVGQLRDEKLTSASKSFGNLLGMWRRGAEAPEADDNDGAADEGEAFPRAAPDVPPRRQGRVALNDDDGGEGEGDWPDGENDASVASARSEISGLMERVRLISHQFKK